MNSFTAHLLFLVKTKVQKTAWTVELKIMAKYNNEKNPTIFKSRAIFKTISKNFVLTIILKILDQDFSLKYKVNDIVQISRSVS